MPRWRSRFLPFLLLVPLVGCGLSHSLVEVPELEIMGTVAQQANQVRSARITVVEAEVYAEPEGVYAILTGMKPHAASGFVRRDEPVSAIGEFHAHLPTWQRYIGFVWPFVPSTENMERRVAYVRLEHGTKTYRIRIIGKQVDTHEIEVQDAFSKMPPELSRAKPPGQLPDWKDLRSYADLLKWRRTDNIRILSRKRTDRALAIAITVTPKH